ncbi:MAG TPA: cupin domain-containing protein, partial [Gaiellaceae bacterium]|nr:cupin domain-containing protein [Gaiellaceae bacterium]
MGYQIADSSKLEWEERPPGAEGQEPRLAADVTTAAGLQQSRGRVWRYPVGTRGRRHADKAQEEVFVVISGAMTMLLGDPPERVDVGPQSVVAVQPGTPLQVRNEGSEELVLYIY